MRRKLLQSLIWLKLLVDMKIYLIDFFMLAQLLRLFCLEPAASFSVEPNRGVRLAPLGLLGLAAFSFMLWCPAAAYGPVPKEETLESI